MSFKEVDDHSRVQAGEAIRTALGNGNNVSRPNQSLEYVAAGAALALERGAPNLMTLSYGLDAGDYLNEGSRAWSSLHGALSQVINTDLDEAKPIPSYGDLVKQTVGNVLQTSSARQVLMAAGNNDMRMGLNDAQLSLVDMCREDQGLLRQMSFIAVGSYERLSPEMSEGLADALSQPIPGKPGLEAESVAKSVDSLVNRLEILHGNYENTNDGLSPRFMPISQDSLNKVVDFHNTPFPEESKSTGDPKIDAAMSILFDQERVPMNLDVNNPIMIAQARLIEEGASRYTDSPADLAAMAITDARIMTQATSHMMDLDFETNHIADRRHVVAFAGMNAADLESVSKGEYHKIDPSHQDNVAYAMALGTAVPPIDRLRLEVATQNGESPSFAMQGVETKSAEKLSNPAGDMLLKAQMAQAAQARSMGM